MERPPDCATAFTVVLDFHVDVYYSILQRLLADFDSMERTSGSITHVTHLRTYLFAETTLRDKIETLRLTITHIRHELALLSRNSSIRHELAFLSLNYSAPAVDKAIAEQPLPVSHSLFLPLTQILFIDLDDAIDDVAITHSHLARPLSLMLTALSEGHEEDFHNNLHIVFSYLHEMISALLLLSDALHTMSASLVPYIPDRSIPVSSLRAMTMALSASQTPTPYIFLSGVHSSSDTYRFYGTINYYQLSSCLPIATPSPAQILMSGQPSVILLYVNIVLSCFSLVCLGCASLRCRKRGSADLRPELANRRDTTRASALEPFRHIRFQFPWSRDDPTMGRASPPVVVL